jgi:hypothetical protein
MKAPMKHFSFAILLLAPLAALHATRNLPGVPRYWNTLRRLFPSIGNFWCDGFR